MKTANENKAGNITLQELINDLFICDSLGPDKTHQIFSEIVVDYMNHNDFLDSINRKEKGLILKKLLFFLSKCKDELEDESK